MGLLAHNLEWKLDITQNHLTIYPTEIKEGIDDLSPPLRSCPRTHQEAKKNKNTDATAF